ncbi:amidohydrolase family protein [Lewinella sp. LCG006]|uniref:amidohydrolase family protein n=1 Tax=Lewinella sp. LCG006 TaxID=3231911 RepID=UPI00345F23D5
MLATRLLTLLCCLASLNLLAQRTPIDSSLILNWEEYDPPSTLVVPETEVTHAKFPFIDVHSHHWRMAEQDLDLLIRQMDSLNMGIVVNLSGRGGQALKDIMDHINASEYKNRIVCFTNIELRSIDEEDWLENTLKQLEFDVSIGARGLKIYKSQGMTNTDKDGNRIKINDPRIAPVWEKCGELGIPVIIHSADPPSFWEPHDENNERWLELKLRPNRKREADDPAPFETILGEAHDIFRQHRGTTFISAHMSWYANDLARLGQFLDDNPNVVVEIGAVIAELGRQPRMAKRFFEQYQDRVLFGKDSYQPNEYPTYFRVLESDDEYFPYYKRYHAFWKMYGLDLPDDVLRKLYYKNALRVIPGLDASLFDE